MWHALTLKSGNLSSPKLSFTKKKGWDYTDKNKSCLTFTCIFPDKVGTSTLPPRIACKKLKLYAINKIYKSGGALTTRKLRYKWHVYVALEIHLNNPSNYNELAFLTNTSKGIRERINFRKNKVISLIRYLWKSVPSGWRRGNICQCLLQSLHVHPLFM